MSQLVINELEKVVSSDSLGLMDISFSVGPVTCSGKHQFLTLQLADKVKH